MNWMINLLSIKYVTYWLSRSVISRTFLQLIPHSFPYILIVRIDTSHFSADLIIAWTILTSGLAIRNHRSDYEIMRGCGLNKRYHHEVLFQSSKSLYGEHKPICEVPSLKSLYGTMYNSKSLVINLIFQCGMGAFLFLSF